MPDELKDLVDVHRDVYQQNGAVSICTHANQAHGDDIASLALLTFLFPKAYINRTRDEAIIDRHLESESGIVVDVGEVYSPSDLAFDHHQDPRLGASFVLVAEHFLGPDWVEDASQVYKWWNAADVNDRAGVNAAVEATSINAVANPPVGSVLRDVVSAHDIIKPGSDLHRTLRMLGKSIISNMHRMQDNRDAILENAEVETMHVTRKKEGEPGDVTIQPGDCAQSPQDFRILTTEVTGSPTIYRLVQRMQPYELSITRQESGQWHLWRDQSVADRFDLTLCKDLPMCTFAHDQGFLAAFKNKRAAIQAVVGLGFELSGEMSAQEFIERVA